MAALHHASDPNSVVVVGAGLAGWTLANELRLQDPAVPIRVVSADAADFYSKPMLSNALALGESVDQLIQVEAQVQADKFGVGLINHTNASHIDADKRLLHTGSGALEFKELVLALGADPVRLPMPGAEHALSVNDWRDYQVFRSKLDAHESARVAIIGSGLIGSEFANDLAAAGHRVEVIDPGQWPVAQWLNAEQGQAMAQALMDLGVRFHWGDVAEQVVQSGVDQSYSLVLRSGDRVEADVVLSAVGLRPRVQLAQAAGLTIERGIVVNEWGQTSNPHIWALGDCAAYESAAEPSGAPKGLPFVLPIMTAARAMAASLAGKATPIRFGAMQVRVKTPAYPVSVRAFEGAALAKA